MAALASPRAHERNVRVVARFRAAIAGAAEGHHQAHEVGPKIRGEVQESLAWLTDVLERMVSGRTKAHELERLLP
jgi:hypothetical protein